MICPDFPWADAGRSNISEKVVVCMPVSCESDISAVFTSSPGMRALSSVLLPTPLLPENRVVFPPSALRNVSMPHRPFVSSMAETP